VDGGGKMANCPVCNKKIPSGLILSMSGRYAKKTINCPFCSTTLKSTEKTIIITDLAFLVGLGLAFLFYYLFLKTGAIILDGIAFLSLIAGAVISFVARMRYSSLEPVVGSTRQK
jgi:hypothetical protein